MTRFNLATYVYTERRIAYALYLLLSLALLSWGYYGVSSYAEARRQYRDLSSDRERRAAEVASLRKELSTLGAAVSSRGDGKAQEKLVHAAERINSILEQKAFSWSELFYALETASPKGVSIRGIKPSYDARKISIRGAAKDLQDVTELMDRLQGTPYIKKTFLLREGEELIDQAYPVISFEIDAEGDF